MASGEIAILSTGPVAYATYAYSVNSMIGSALAGQILGWSQRRVQRNARQLGGRFVSGRWILDESKVLARAAQQAEKAKGVIMQGDESKFPAPEGVKELQQDAARRTRMFLAGTNDASTTAAAIRARFGAK